MTTANHIADNLDDLSDFLGPEDQGRIDVLTEALSNVVFPENYRALLTVARTAIGLYTDLLEDIGDRERFEADP